MKKSPEKPRIDIVEVDFGKDVVITGESAPGEEKFCFFGENGEEIFPEYITTGKGYERNAKPPKIVTQIEEDPQNVLSDPNQILKSFDHLLAIDTNTNTINGISVSVSAFFLVKNIEIRPPVWNVQLFPLEVVEFHECLVPAEKIGWYYLIKRCIENNVSGRVGVITDHDLANIRAYNDRKKPIVNNVFLSDGFELIYASAERDTKYQIANAAIAQCDKTADQLLKHLRGKGAGNTNNYINIVSQPYRLFSRYRCWNVEENKDIFLRP